MTQSRETYTHGYHDSVVEQHAMRTAGEAAAFLKPYLRPEMSLLDIGCGPGSITVGLAEWLPEGNVVDVIVDGTISTVVNTVTGERRPLHDGFYIRRAAADHRVPCFTSIDTARAAVESIKGSSFNVKRLDEYLAG